MGAPRKCGDERITALRKIKLRALGDGPHTLNSIRAACLPVVEVSEVLKGDGKEIPL